MSNLQENYAKAYSNKSGYGQRPALVLIDFAHAYFDPDCVLFGEEGCKTALASALRVREAAHAAGVPVILTEVTYQKGLGGRDGGRFFEKALPLQSFMDGESTARFADGLTPRPDELVVSKQYPSAFFGTSLASTLTAAGHDSVILTGLTTSGCVRASCVDSMSYGFKTIVVADACGDRHKDPHEANLFDMNAKYADVVSEEEIIGYLATLSGSAAAE